MVQAQSARNFCAVVTQQTALRTAETTGFTYLPMKSGGITLTRPSKPSDELYGYEQRLMRAQNSSVGGTFPILLYFNQVGQFIANFLQQQSSDELASFTVTNSNKYIDFAMEGGDPVTAVIPLGTYTIAELSDQFDTQMEEQVTDFHFSLTYNATTKKISFNSLTDNTTFRLNFLTGPNHLNSIASLIGFFATDHTGALTYVADTAKPVIYTHIFVPDKTAQFTVKQDNGLTLLDNIQVKTKEAIGAMVNAFTYAYAENDPHAPALTIGFKAAAYNELSEVTPTFSSDVPATPQANVTMTIVANGHTHTAHYFKNLTVQITPAVDTRFTIGDEYAVAVFHTGKIAYTVSWAWDLETRVTDGSAANYRSDHQAVWADQDDTVFMTLMHTGQTLRGTIKESIKFEFKALRPGGTTPTAQGGTIEAPYTYTGEYDMVNDRFGLVVTLVSTEYIPMS